MLVYRSGMAVTAAAEGMLEPAFSRNQPSPSSVPEAMQHLRADGSTANAPLAAMVFDHPSVERFGVVERAASRMQLTAQWMSGSPELKFQHPDFSKEAGKLVSLAAKLSSAVGQGKVDLCQRALTEMTVACIGCHEEKRWSSSGPAGASASQH